MPVSLSGIIHLSQLTRKALHVHWLKDIKRAKPNPHVCDVRGIVTKQTKQ